jgi:hypothetical protein
MLNRFMSFLEWLSNDRVPAWTRWAAVIAVPLVLYGALTVVLDGSGFVYQHTKQALFPERDVVTPADFEAGGRYSGTSTHR